MSGWHALMRRHGVRSSKGRAANGNVIFATFPHDTATSKWYVKIRAQKSERESKDGPFLLSKYDLKAKSICTRYFGLTCHPASTKYTHMEYEFYRLRGLNGNNYPHVGS